MINSHKPQLVVAMLVCTAISLAEPVAAIDPLPSWNDGKSKLAIIQFVERVTDEQSPDFVPVPERIATFDNDGALWCEQPMYVQLAFAIDRVKQLAGQHPEWQTQEPFASVLKGDMDRVAASGKKGLLELIGATHAGMTNAEFAKSATDWIATAQHPRFQRPYTECIYQPMLELLDYLRQHEFKTFIVSGGGIEFMRPWTEKVYGIPPEQVVGSSIKLKYDVRNSEPVLVRLAEIDFIDDKAGKPVGIQSHIGRRPIFAAGNSDGDYEMLRWTTSGEGPRFGMIVHHTDAEREYAYDRESPIGQLVEALDEAPKQGWTVVDMRNDWRQIFPEAANSKQP